MRRRPWPAGRMSTFFIGAIKAAPTCSWGKPTPATSGASPTTSLGSSTRFERRVGLLPDLHVFVGRERAHPYVRDRVLRNARANAHQRAEMDDRRVHDPIDRQLLDLVEHGLALLGVTLDGLLLKELVDIGITAISVGALGLDEGFDAARGIARVAGPSHEQAAQFLGLPIGIER